MSAVLPNWVKTISPNALIDREELAAWLGVTAYTLTKMLNAGELPPSETFVRVPLGDYKTRRGPLYIAHGNPKNPLGNKTPQRWRVSVVRQWLRSRAQQG